MRHWALGFGYAGAASCAAMVFVGRTDWVLGAVLFISAFFSYSCAKVIYNSLLVDLADPDLRDRMSLVEWAVGCLGSGILLALNFGSSWVIHDPLLLARLSLGSAGVWWAVFALVPLRMLRHLPRSATQRQPMAGGVVSAGFRQLGDTLRNLKKFPLTLLFLAYLVYYDGISTVTTLSADYGQMELQLGETTLLGAILMVQFTGFGGALLLGRFADRYGVKPVITASLLVWIGVVVAAYFLQAGKAPQFYALTLVLAIVLGGTQALSRSLFAGMIPLGNKPSTTASMRSPARAPAH